MLANACLRMNWMGSSEKVLVGVDSHNSPSFDGRDCPTTKIERTSTRIGLLHEMYVQEIVVHL